MALLSFGVEPTFERFDKQIRGRKRVPSNR